MSKKPEPVCPCCKYQPKKNPSGSIRKSYKEFEEVVVSHDYDKKSYDSASEHTFLQHQ